VNLCFICADLCPMKKILIIEDEESILEMYKMRLEQEGYLVIASNNGTDGIALAKKEKPDLILLDLVIPEIDGYQVLKKLRADQNTKNIKIYILSNLGQSQEINKGFTNGADGYLIKASLTPSQLSSNVKNIFAGQAVGLRKKRFENKKSDFSQVIFDKPELNMNKKADILIVEDEEAIAEMYKIGLEKEGYRVEIAKNGAWGLKLAKDKKFAVIVFDMVMPAMKGHDAIRELKADNKTKDVPIIVLSNSAQDEDIKAAKETGISRYLLKSQITPTKLTKEVKKLLKD